MKLGQKKQKVHLLSFICPGPIYRTVQTHDLSICSRIEEDHTKPKASEPTDPAALIAEALKRKFAHRYRNDSECENNFSLPSRESKPCSDTPAVRSTFTSCFVFS